MKKIFKIDLSLYVIGVITAITGFGLHVAGRGINHAVWEAWAYAHTLTAIIFVYLVAQHLLTHKGWIKGLKASATRKKHRATIGLGILAIWVSLTGFALLAIWGTNTHTGLLHYKLGIVFTLIALAHAAKRFHIIRKVC